MFYLKRMIMIFLLIIVFMLVSIPVTQAQNVYNQVDDATNATIRLNVIFHYLGSSGQIHSATFPLRAAEQVYNSAGAQTGHVEKNLASVIIRFASQSALTKSNYNTPLGSTTLQPILYGAVNKHESADGYKALTQIVNYGETRLPEDVVRGYSYFQWRIGYASPDLGPGTTPFRNIYMKALE